MLHNTPQSLPVDVTCFTISYLKILSLFSLISPNPLHHFLTEYNIYALGAALRKIYIHGNDRFSVVYIDDDSYVGVDINYYICIDWLLFVLCFIVLYIWMNEIIYTVALVAAGAEPPLKSHRLR